MENDYSAPITFGVVTLVLFFFGASIEHSLFFGGLMSILTALELIRKQLAERCGSGKIK